MQETPNTPPKERHVRSTEKLVLKENRSLWGMVIIIIVMVLAYELYNQYYGHQHFFPKLQQGVLSR